MLVASHMVFPYQAVLDGNQSTEDQLLDSNLKLNKGILLFSLGSLFWILKLHFCRDIEALRSVIVLLFQMVCNWFSRGSLGITSTILQYIALVPFKSPTRAAPFSTNRFLTRPNKSLYKSLSWWIIFAPSLWNPGCFRVVRRIFSSEFLYFTDNNWLEALDSVTDWFQSIGVWNLRATPSGLNQSE